MPPKSRSSFLVRACSSPPSLVVFVLLCDSRQFTITPHSNNNSLGCTATSPQSEIVGAQSPTPFPFPAAEHPPASRVQVFRSPVLCRRPRPPLPTVALTYLIHSCTFVTLLPTFKSPPPCGDLGWPASPFFPNELSLAELALLEILRARKGPPYDVIRGPQGLSKGARTRRTRTARNPASSQTRSQPSATGDRHLDGSSLQRVHRGACFVTSPPRAEDAFYIVLSQCACALSLFKLKGLSLYTPYGC